METIGHLLSSCENYKWTLYKNHHDRVLYQLTNTVASKLKVVLPQELRAPGGAIKSGVIGTPSKRLLLDQNIPTVHKIEERKPDLVVRLREEKRILIFEVAIAWEPLVPEHENQKKKKYQELSADMATQY